MKRALEIGILAATLLTAATNLAQRTTPGTTASATPVVDPHSWAFSLTVDGYIVPSEPGYASPIFAADRKWLHLEARYDYENLRTGSLWLGYNFSIGKTLVFAVTPMIGGVFGRTNGIAPGCEASLTYKRLEISISNEYVFDTGGKSGNFYYAWPQLTYSPRAWFKVGVVAQQTKAFQTDLDTQRGFLVGISHKKAEFTTYVFNAGWTDPTIVLEVGYKF